MRTGNSSRKKGTALLVVLLTLLITALLATVVLRFMLSQGSFSRQEINRIRAYYAAYAAMNYTLEKLRIGDWSPNPNATDPVKKACLNGCVGMGVIADPGYTIPSDTDIPCKVEVTIHPYGSSVSYPADKIAPLEITAEYDTP